MKSPRRSLRPLAIGVALSVALVACSDTTDDPATAPVAAAEDSAANEPSEPPETTPTETTPTEAAETPEEMDEHEERSGTNPFLDLRMAAAHVGNDGSAKAIAGGIVTAAGLEGDIDSPAVQTYAALSTLLQEHVYLAGIAVDVAVLTAPDDPRFEAATAALDENSVDLADLVGSVAPDQRDAFLALWREHIGFFVDYTLGVAGDDQEAQQTALDNLNGYRQQAGAFFEEITAGELPADAVAESLSGHIDTLTAAIDAAVAQDTSVFSELKMAATHVGETGSAKALSSGIAAAAGMDGDIESPAAQAYVTLSTLLEEHVYLAGTSVVTAYASGADSDMFKAAAGVLDENSVELADLIGSVAPDQRDAFLALWREHIGYFVDYAVAQAGGDEQAKQTALDNLDGYRQQAGAFFEEVTGGELPADAVAESLSGHIDTLTAVIDGAAAAFAS